MSIKTIEDLDKAIEAGPYAWPGGYPVYFITADGASLSYEAVKQERGLIAEAIKDNDERCGWRVVASDINWEDDQLYCEHTGKRIESAYAEKD